MPSDVNPLSGVLPVRQVTFLLKIQPVEGGFALHPVVRDDLGMLVFQQGEDLIVELPNGQTVPLLTTLAAMLEGMTVTGFLILTAPSEKVA